MEQFWLLRIEYARFDEKNFQKTIGNLGSTKYYLSAKDSEAPWITHCVSAVRHILRRTTGWMLPHYYVGNMCRKILDNSRISSHLIPLEEWEMGDLIFFHRKSAFHQAYMITHMWICMDENSFFHSSWWNWGKINKINDCLSKGNIATCKILSNFTDPREKVIL